MKKIFTIVLYLQLSACAVYPQSNSLLGYLRLTDYYQLERQRNFTIPAKSTIYIPVSWSGVNEDDESKQQYLRLLGQTASSFRAGFQRVDVGAGEEGSKQALQSARQLDCNYVLFIVPSDWHEGRDLPLFVKSKGTSGIDKVRLAIKLVEASSGVELDHIEIQGRSGYFSFLGDAPSDLARVPLNQFARNLRAGQRPIRDGSY